MAEVNPTLPSKPREIAQPKKPIITPEESKNLVKKVLPPANRLKTKVPEKPEYEPKPAKPVLSKETKTPPPARKTPPPVATNKQKDSAKGLPAKGKV